MIVSENLFVIGIALIISFQLSQYAYAKSWLGPPDVFGVITGKVSPATVQFCIAWVVDILVEKYAVGNMEPGTLSLFEIGSGAVIKL
jgi:uncharacterized membrane protein (DUF485 family)